MLKLVESVCVCVATRPHHHHHLTLLFQKTKSECVSLKPHVFARRDLSSALFTHTTFHSLSLPQNFFFLTTLISINHLEIFSIRNKVRD